MAFHVVLYSNSDPDVFPDNTSSHFTSLLNRNILLKNEYNVAVSSVIPWSNTRTDLLEVVKEKSGRGIGYTHKTTEEPQSDQPASDVAHIRHKRIEESVTPKPKANEVVTQKPKVDVTQPPKIAVVTQPPKIAVVTQPPKVDGVTQPLIASEITTIKPKRSITITTKEWKCEAAPTIFPLYTLTVQEQTAIIEMSRKYLTLTPAYILEKGAEDNQFFFTVHNSDTEAVLGKTSKTFMLPPNTNFFTRNYLQELVFEFPPIIVEKLILTITYVKGDVTAHVSGDTEELNLRPNWRLDPTGKGKIIKIWSGINIYLPKNENTVRKNIMNKTFLLDTAPDLRNKDHSEIIVAANLSPENVDKYNDPEILKNIGYSEILADFKMETFPNSQLAGLEDTEPSDLMSEWISKSIFNNDFELFSMNDIIPKKKKGTIIYSLTDSIARLMKIPKVFKANDGRLFKVKIFDPPMDYIQEYEIDIIDFSNIPDFIQKRLTIPEPYQLTFKTTKAKNAITKPTLAISFSACITVTVPYAFNCYTVTCLKAIEQWTISVLYKSPTGMEKIKKNFVVERQKTDEEQVKAIDAAAKKAFNDNDLEFKVTYNVDGAEGGVAMSNNYHTVTLPSNLAKLLRIPPILIREKKFAEATDSVTKIIPSFSPIWITCDLVDETLIAGGAMKLLTPSPINISSGHGITSRQYVPVSVSSFSQINIYCYSDVIMKTPYLANDGILIVLHFVPRYKRVRSFAENDTQEYYKKICYG